MPENVCTKTNDAEWTSDWEYIGAYPTRQVTSTAPGAVRGTADPIYIWRRTFKVKYSCTCNGKTAEVWVDGNYSYYHKEVLGSSYQIIGLGLPLPLKGALSTLADVLGVSLTLVEWWVNPLLVDSRKGADPGPDESGSNEDRKAAPFAICGDELQIRLGNGTLMPWPKEGTVADDSNPYIMLECPNGTAEHGEIALGWTIPSRSSEYGARSAALAMCVVRARYRAGRYAAYYRCAAPCESEPAVSFSHEGERIGLEPTKTKDDTYICIAYLPWKVKISCSRRTSMLNKQGQHYAKGSFMASGAGYNDAIAKQALLKDVREKAWDAGMEILMEAHFNAETNSTPYFRIGIDKVDFIEYNKIEGLEEQRVFANASWHLELEDDRDDEQRKA